MSDIVSAFPFYGGKAKMAKLIAEMLTYDRDVYIEPFGGGARVLLNKPRHKKEIYGDTSLGLTTFWKVVKSVDKVKLLVERLNDLEPTKENFIEQLRIKMSIEQTPDVLVENELRRIVYAMQKKADPRKNGKQGRLYDSIKKLRSIILQSEYEKFEDAMNEVISINEDEKIIDVEEIAELEKLKGMYLTYYNLIKEDYFEAKECLYKECEKVNGNKIFSKRQIDKFAHKFALKEVNRMGIESYPEFDEIELACATFFVYTLSRDGMGNAFSDMKSEKIEDYYERVDNLYTIQGIMEDVEIINMDAMLIIEKYIGEKDVIMYLDPSYLNVTEKDGEKQRDLGKGIYNTSLSKEDHKRLVALLLTENSKNINEKAKVIVSNYDVEPYRQLDRAGWKRAEFETTTAVGGKAGNTRKEVLWYNY